jgi:hypothetical protein
MPLKTPPLHAKGIYQLLAPWTISATVLYECIAIRSFSDFIEKGENVFEKIYQPKGLTQAQYEADKAAGANIITLASGSLPVVHVPDTYIAAYPTLSNVAYKSVVLSVALGPLPDATDLTFLTTQVQGVVSDVIGVTSEVKIHVLPNNDVFTETQAEALETARQAAITNRKTDRAKLLEATETIAALQAKLATMQQIIIDNGYATPAP